MKTRLASILTFLVVFQLLSSCEKKQLSPKEVVEKFSIHISKGECTEAKELCDEQGKQFLNAILDAGYVAYEMTIDSIRCQTNDSIAKCTCYEKRSTESFSSRYKLLKINGEWKITSLPKDSVDW